jgi:predicted DCC family thiol-disulfide oxidoreductase YuxK
VIRHDPRHRFRFASLQGNFGQQVLKEHQLDPAEYDSIILLEREKIYTSSGAALRVIRKLNGAWPLLYIFIIIPPFIRNAVYGFIAARRYQWFGKKEACWLPSPELKQLFID